MPNGRASLAAPASRVVTLGVRATREAGDVASAPDVLIVSHTHWDREWYRTFEAFRARLVDTVDRVLDLLAADPGWKFLLDGQAIVVEDYLAVRPERRGEVEAAVTAGRLGVGPWYVQPDSLLPSGEAHVRNLLEGRRVARAIGACSEVAYTPDSFGHPAQLPAIFAGFGLGPFVYWRGNGNEIDTLGPVYRWVAPSGDAVTAYHLARGYFAAAYLPEPAEDAADALVGLLDRLAGVERAPVVLMNGIDHCLPDAHTGAVAEALAARTGRTVRRGLLDDLRAELDESGRPGFTGELLGARVANLLPGVWSTRLGLKLADRAAERALGGWAEPWAALGPILGTPDERSSVRAAWRALLPNQAHDSICGCSQDEGHRQMRGRYATATELALETTDRVLGRLAGLGPTRATPWATELDLAVFNPSPVARTDVVRVPLDGHPVYRLSDLGGDIHPLTLLDGTNGGYTADGAPARVVAADDPRRMRMWEGMPGVDLELVVADVPAFGWRRVHLAPADPTPDEVDEGRSISSGEGPDALAVEAAGDGTLTLHAGGRTFTGLGALEDLGGRGGTDDFHPGAGDHDAGAAPVSVRIERRRHLSGLQRLVVERSLDVPRSLTEARDARTDETVPVTVRLEARVAPGVDRVDLDVAVSNAAEDHRLRLRFPTGAPVDRFRAATTFDVAERSTTAADDAGWEHVAPRTFPHQGWIEAHGLVVAAPGLPEAEVTPDGEIVVTLLRSVGWLARLDPTTRPIPAGPGLFTPEAQCPEGISARLSLRVVGPGEGPAAVAAQAVADELGLRAVPAGDAVLGEPGGPMVEVAPDEVVLSALKPADDGEGLVVRLINPGPDPVESRVTLGFPVAEVESVRLDETPDRGPVTIEAHPAGRAELRLTVGAHGLRTVRLRPA